jgi:hypothetical protein
LLIRRIGKRRALGAPYSEQKENFTMRYLLMIYTNEQNETDMTPEDFEATMQAYNAFTSEVRERGLYEGGEALQPTTTATTVRVRESNTMTTDGPYAETKEQLGGYYLLNCKDLDEAIECAAKIPGALHGAIEIRPIMEFE